ncbi:MAG: hypothetical protein H0X39_02275 [Actinobacteria bacterium]|nr:hypothetical protein [Actinomycetota bacterium]
MHVLVLYWHPVGAEMRPAVNTHLHTLDMLPDLEVEYCNAYVELPDEVERAHWDAVVLHTTFLCMRWSDAFTAYALRIAWLAKRECLKIAIPQDEYDHSEILDEWLYSLGVTHVFSNFDEGPRKLLYPILHDRASFSVVLTGYVNQEIVESARAQLLPIAERSVDVVYRAADLPYWFGANGQRKVAIGRLVARGADELGLKTDISSRPEDTIYGDGWTRFLLSSKSVTGCETGSTALDRRGEIQASIRAMLAADSALSFTQVAARLPAGWDDHPLTAIGPRHFEAVATKTCQILVDGHYSGILEAGRHYVGIAADFSNLSDVLERVRDDAPGLQMIADTAYEDIVGSGQYTYARLAEQFATALGTRPAAR